MASLAPLIVAFAAAASCSALLPGASAAAASRPPAVYVVGDAMGWSVPPTNATDALNKWAISNRFHVGDVLDFRYSKNNDDSVLLVVRRRDYDACSAASPACRLTGGDAKFRLDRPGLLYFIGGVPARCEAGQRMVVHVVDARSSLGGGGAPTPAPAPAPGGPEDDEPTTRSPSGDRPIPVPFTVFVAGFIGFMSGLFFGGLVLWLFINWCR